MASRSDGVGVPQAFRQFAIALNLTLDRIQRCLGYLRHEALKRTVKLEDEASISDGLGGALDVQRDFHLHRSLHIRRQLNLLAFDRAI